MEKVLYYNNLFNFYGKLLTTKEQEIFVLYYEENLSMQEIADLMKISKSAVGQMIKTVENKLNHYEEILKVATNLERVLNLVNDEKLKEQISDIYNEE